MRTRFVFILIFLTALWGVVIARAAFLQLWPNERLKALQKRQFETVVTLNARRGDVLDRNGHELAVSMATYSLFADPKIIEEPRKVARFLARQLNIPVKQIEAKLRVRRKRFVWIERQLSKSVRDAIAEQEIRGLGFIEESNRIYPNEKLLSQVLGFVGESGQGLEGLELKYNEHLQAARKKVSVRRDARGRPLIVNGQIFNQIPDGSDIQLTVDRELQFVLEQELALAVQAHRADSAVGVILDAQTSEILAMVSSPTFDPNRPADFSLEQKRNRAVTDSFEPGSTMKTLIVAGAMAKGLIEPNTRFDCEGGRLRVGNRVIKESDSHHKFGSLTVAEILAVSSNVGMTKIAFKLGSENVLDALRSFGIGEKTGVDLPGEARGIVQPLPWREHLLANISIGHGVTATPLQIANAYAVIANGGWLKQPSIVKSVRDHESDEVTTMTPRTLRRVLNDQEVAKLRIMLTGVTSSDFGTGGNARVAGFPVAGKTGTAQKVNPNGRGYLQGGYVSSFAGFLPANDPRFVIFVAIDHPRKDYYSASVAAPVFSRVATFAVRRAGLAPVLISEGNLVPKAKRVAASDVSPRPMPLAAAADSTAGRPELQVVPNLTGMSLREVLSRVSATGVQVRVHGQGFVSHTLPPHGAQLIENKDLNVYLSQ